jgi:hypothetical protein
VYPRRQVHTPVRLLLHPKPRLIVRPRAVSSIVRRVDDSKNFVHFLLCGLGVDGGGVLNVIPVFVACDREEALFEGEDLARASGRGAAHNKCAGGGEEVGKLGCRGGGFRLGVESAGA